MNSAGLSALIKGALGDLGSTGEPRIQLRRTAHGTAHWSTPVALTIGADDPQVLARLLAERLRAEPGIADVTVNPPGFLDISLDVAELAGIVRRIVDAGATDQSPRQQVQEGGDDVRAARSSHGRLCNLSRQAADHGVDRSAFAPDELTGRTEIELLLALAEADEVARTGDPERVLHHLGLLAETFERCFASTRLTPRGLDPVTDLHRTRLWLYEATRMTLANGLHRLGLTAPEHI